jgi:hypothetical protein
VQCLNQMSIRRKVSLSITILIPALLLIVNLAHGQDCEKLKDGKYKVKFKRQYGGDKYVLLLEGDSFTNIKHDQEIKGKVKVNEDCTLRLDYLIKPDTTNSVQKILSNSFKPYFEFENTSGRKLKFRLTGYGGPHTTAGEGYIIKID